MCTCITFCWTRHLSNTTLIGPVAFGGLELCVCYYILLDQTVTLHYFDWPVTCGGRALFVLVLHSAEPDSYVTLL